MKKVTYIPDKILHLDHGDKVEITLREKDVLFVCHVDGDGCCFALNKKELKEMLK